MRWGALRRRGYRHLKLSSFPSSCLQASSPQLESCNIGTSLMVQGLRVHLVTAGDADPRTNIPPATEQLAQYCSSGLPRRPSGKEYTCQGRRCVQLPGSGRPPKEYGSPLQCSCLENPKDRGAWRATVQGVAKSRTRLSTHAGEGRLQLESLYATMKDNEGCNWDLTWLNK